MFNLGYKEVIVNSDSDITAVDGGSAATSTIAIDGFCNLGVGEISGLARLSSAAGAVGSVTTTAVPAVVVGSSYTLAFTIKSIANERIDPLVFSNGEKKVLNFKGKTNVGVDAAATYTWQKENESGFEFPYVITNVGGEVKIEAAEVGFSIVDVSLTEIPAAIGSAPVDVPLGVLAIAEGSIGVGLGSQLEAEVKNATFDNIDPYGVRFGGSAIVDVRGTYSQYIITTKDANGWAHHETMGYGLNGEIAQADRKIVIWLNEVSASVAKGILDGI